MKKIALRILHAVFAFLLPTPARWIVTLNGIPHWTDGRVTLPVMAGGALTLAEADKFSTNEVWKGVAETSMDANPLLGMIPFVGVLGNAYQYLRENAASPPTFIAPNGTVTEGAPTVTQVLLALKILIGDVDIDKFLRVTRSKDQDIEAELIAVKARNFADTWGDAVIYGSIDTDANQFDGLHEIAADDLPAAQTINISADATPDPASFTFLDQLIDLVRPRPDVIIASRRSIRGIQKLARSQGWDLALSTIQGINRPVRFYSDIPLIPCDFITDTETISAGGLFTVKTGGTASSIFALRFGEDAFHGINAIDPDAGSAIESIIQIEQVGTLETKDANRTRLKHYGAVGAKSTQCIARLTGASGGDWTN